MASRRSSCGSLGQVVDPVRSSALEDAVPVLLEHLHHRRSGEEPEMGPVEGPVIQVVPTSAISRHTIGANWMLGMAASTCPPGASQGIVSRSMRPRIDDVLEHVVEADEVELFLSPLKRIGEVPVDHLVEAMAVPRRAACEGTGSTPTMRPWSPSTERNVGPKPPRLQPTSNTERAVGGMKGLTSSAADIGIEVLLGWVAHHVFLSVPSSTI